jgi:hypothetical protein
METAAREEILLRSKMVAQFPSSTARLTRAQQAALASVLARWDILVRVEPRSRDEEVALLLLAHLRHAIDGFILIDRENDPWFAAESWQRRLDWLAEYGTRHSIEEVLARRTVLAKRNPSLMVFADRHVELWSVPKPERGPMQFRTSAEPAEPAQLARVK